jgi:cobalt/nickel transport system permease protein
VLAANVAEGPGQHAMRHDFWDRYSCRPGPLQSLDPRSRFLAAVAFVFAVVACSPTWPLAALGGVLVAIAAIAAVPAGYLLRRALWVLPFLAVVAVGRPANVPFWPLVGRGLLSAMALVLLSATTPFPALLAGLDRMGAPRFFLGVLAFAYRYVFLLTDEAERMEMGWRSRSMGLSSTGWRALSSGLGVLFVRTHERAERVYMAMLGRGFGGTFPPPRPLLWQGRDTLVVLAAGALLLAAVSSSGGGV